jgi:hypothetical protein
MPTTSEIRTWSPACKTKTQSLTGAYKALDAWLKKFLYAPEQYHTGAFNCRQITGGTSYSLHAYNPNGPFVFWSGAKVTMAIAVDINWQRNPYGKVLITDMPSAMVAAIKAVRTNSGKQVWRWGGDYTGNKDAMHYEIICHPKDLATGINPATLPGAQPQPIPVPPVSPSTVGSSGDAMFATCLLPDGGLAEAMIGTDGGVYYRVGANLLELSRKAPSSLGGHGKSVNIYVHNGRLVVAIHGMNDIIHYNVLGPDLQWGGWFGGTNHLLHPLTIP